jgi:hypothetical protein
MQLYLLQSFMLAEFVGGSWNLLSLPDGLIKKEIEQRVGDKIGRKVGNR